MFRDVLGRAHHIYFLFAITLVGCGGAGLPSPSTNLSEVTSAYPSVVEVILPGGAGLCSGTFISQNAVLTAAHCALTNGTYTVVAGFGTFTTSNKLAFGPGIVNDPNDIAILWFNTNVASMALGQVSSVYDKVATGDTLELVGFGCNNIATESGAGTKRAGSNVVEAVDEYIEFVTPSGSWSQKVLGPDNRAGSCFGDSGGPALKSLSSGVVLVGVTHAGGTNGNNLDSEYVDITRADNRGFLASANTTYNLNIQGL